MGVASIYTAGNHAEGDNTRRATTSWPTSHQHHRLLIRWFGVRAPGGGINLPGFSGVGRAGTGTGNNFGNIGLGRGNNRSVIGKKASAAPGQDQAKPFRWSPATLRLQHVYQGATLRDSGHRGNSAAVDHVNGYSACCNASAQLVSSPHSSHPAVGSERRWLEFP